MAKQNKPAIRFKGFTDAWEQRKLGDNIVEYTEVTTENNQYPPLTSSRKGIFLQTEYFAGNQIASDDNTGYNIVPYGYFTYRHMSDDEVFHFNINDIVEKGIVSTLYPVFTTDENLDSRYLQYQLNYGHEFAKFAILQKQGGSRTYMYLNKLRQLHLTMPNHVEEQKAISSFFMNLDHLITLHQRKFDKLQVLKKAMLEKMFPKNGSSVPEIRFKGFTDAWEQRKLGEFFEKYQNTVYLQDEEEYRQISIRNTGVVEYRCTNKGKNIGRKRQYLIDTDTHPVTLTFTRQTVYEGGIGFVPKELNGAIVTENMPLLEMTNASQDFMKALFNTSGYYKSVINDDTLIGSAQKALHEKQWLDSYVCIPVLDEQKQIGSFFQQLEHLITLHQRKSYIYGMSNFI